MSDKSSCADCRFIEKNRDALNAWFCVRNPPSVQVLPMPTPAGMQWSVQAFKAPTALDSWCGEHKPQERTLAVVK